MISYKIIRSKRKTLSIHITKDASVEVRAPLNLPAADIEHFLLQKKNWIENTKQKILRANLHKISVPVEKELQLRRRAQEIIPSKVSYYAAIMNVTPTAVKINGAKTLWGSCSGKNSLNFSYRLILGADEIIDYVVVHELAHIKEHNHSARFWKEVSFVLPDYKERQKKLKELQLLLDD